MAQQEGSVGGFTHRDGTIAFYSRVNALLRPQDVVLDFGAGRGLAQDDPVAFRRSLMTLRGRTERVIAMDVDAAVMSNSMSDEQIVMANSSVIALSDSSVDLVLADNVFEHIADPIGVSKEFARVVKPGGWVCARTPNLYGYIAVGARLIPNSMHSKIVRRLQPGSLRNETDVFPTIYKMNSRRQLKTLFAEKDWQLFVVSNRPDAGYAAGIRAIGALQLMIGAVPGASPMLHVFARRLPLE